MLSAPIIGVGLRHPHYRQFLEERPDIDWVEVHSENFFQKGGAAREFLHKVRSLYPISLHGVGLSLGSADGVLKHHLDRLKDLVEFVDPVFVSEHLSWGRVGKTYLHDLLPLPYNAESDKVFCENVSRTQDYLRREILIENPSSYLEYRDSDQEEASFLGNLARRTGCKILLDINNVFVSCSNHGWDPIKYINEIPREYVKEIHLAGHSLKEISPGNVIRIDTHDQPVCDEVWELYDYAVHHFGTVSTLLERDQNIPSLEALLSEASKIKDYLPQGEKKRAISF